MLAYKYRLTNQRKCTILSYDQIAILIGAKRSKKPPKTEETKQPNSGFLILLVGRFFLPAFIPPWVVNQ
jgi:hypothetical protein